MRSRKRPARPAENKSFRHESKSREQYEDEDVVRKRGDFFIFDSVKCHSRVRLLEHSSSDLIPIQADISVVYY